MFIFYRGHPQPKAPLSSSTESEALRIGDLSPPVIPYLMRDPVLSGFPFSREWHTPCHPQPKAPLSSSTESEALRIGDPVLSGFPFSREWPRLESFASNGNDTFFVILNRKRSASDWGSIPSRHSALDAGSIRTGFPFSREWPRLESFASNGNDTFFVILNRKPPCHPQPKAKCFGLGIQLDLDSRFHGNDKRRMREWQREIREWQAEWE